MFHVEQFWQFSPAGQLLMERFLASHTPCPPRRTIIRESRRDSACHAKRLPRRPAEVHNFFRPGLLITPRFSVLSYSRQLHGTHRVTAVRPEPSEHFPQVPRVLHSLARTLLTARAF